MFIAVVECGYQTCSLHGVRRVGADQVAQGWENIEHIHIGGSLFTRGHARSGKYQGYAHAVFVHVLFAEKPVLPHGETIVPGKDDDGIIRHSECAYCVEHAPHLSV